MDEVEGLGGIAVGFQQRDGRIEMSGEAKCGYRVEDCVCSLKVGHVGKHVCRIDDEPHYLDIPAEPSPVAPGEAQRRCPKCGGAIGSNHLTDKPECYRCGPIPPSVAPGEPERPEPQEEIPICSDCEWFGCGGTKGGCGCHCHDPRRMYRRIEELEAALTSCREELAKEKADRKYELEVLFSGRGVSAELRALREERDQLLGKLKDSGAAHMNILRGDIALTKAQAVHIAGLPADVEEQLAALREERDRAQAALRDLLKEAEAFAKVLPAYSQSEPLKAARAALKPVSDRLPEGKTG